MKKTLKIFAAVLAVAQLAACGGKNIDTSSLATALLDGGEYAEELSEVGALVMEKRCNIDEELVEISSAFKGTSAVADEIIVIKSKDADEVSERLEEYRQNRIKSYESYLPIEVPKLNDAILSRYKDTVIFCVSEDSDRAREIIENYLKN